MPVLCTTERSVTRGGREGAWLPGLVREPSCPGRNGERKAAGCGAGGMGPSSLLCVLLDPAHTMLSVVGHSQSLPKGGLV